MRNEGSVRQPQATVVLTALRDKSRLGLEGWAKRIGVARRTVERWEDGDSHPQPVNIDNLIEVSDELSLLPLDIQGYTVNDTFSLRSILTKPWAFDLNGKAFRVGGSPKNRLDWKASSGAASYAVYRNGSHYIDQATLEPTFEDTEVTPGATYTYLIRATNEAGCTDSNTITIETLEAVTEPGAFILSGKVFRVGGSPENRLDWTASSGATSYAVYRNGSHYIDRATLESTFKDTEVTPGATYTYLIRATNEAGCTDSNTITIEIPEHVNLMIKWIYRHRERRWLAAAVALIAIVLLTYFVVVPGNGETPDCVSLRTPLSAPPSDFTATITTPGGCSTDLSSGVAIPTSGTYQGDLAGNSLWLLVYAPDGKYYVQSSNTCRGLPAQAAQSRWSTTTYLGEVGMDSDQFDIVLTVSASKSEASNVFTQWLRETCGFPRPGFDALPPGLAEVIAITVRTGSGN